jgi:hypothetical protein
MLKTDWKALHGSLGVFMAHKSLSEHSHLTPNGCGIHILDGE